MSIYPKFTPLRFTQTKNVGKYKNSGLIFNMVNKLDNLAAKLYFNDTNTFLSTTTAGFSVSSYDTSGELIPKDYSTNYVNLTPKPTQLAITTPNNLAAVANAQVDQAVSVDLSINNIIRVVFKSNYSGATATYRLSSDAGYTNTISWSITGSTVAVNGVFTTIADLKVGVNSTIAGTPDLKKIIRSRLISVNSTATNRVAPISVFFAPNITALPGSVITFKACCADEPLLKRELSTAELKCGQSTTGEVGTEDKFTLSFSLMEESPDLLALTVGDIATIRPTEVFNHLAGFEPGNDVTKIVGNIAVNPVYGTLAVAPNLKICSVNDSGCGTLQQVEYNATMLTTQNGGLEVGQFAYDSVLGVMVFNTTNIGIAPEITTWVTKDIVTITPAPLKLGHKTSVVLQDVNSEDKTKYYFVKGAQLKFPDFSIEDEGSKTEFELTCFFSKKGDVVIGYDV